VEQTLDLRRVKVDSNNMVDPGSLHQVRDQAGGDWLAAADPSVLASVAEVGHHPS
jgi:hypothetical protein